MDNENTWWYLFDGDTYAYLGMLLTDTQPDNSTDVAPGGVTNPVWNPTLKVWNGEDVDDKLNDLNDETDNDNVPINVQMNNILSKLEELKQDVEALKNK